MMMMIKIVMLVMHLLLLLMMLLMLVSLMMMLTALAMAMAMVSLTEVWLVRLPTGLPDGEWAHLSCWGAAHTAPEHPCTRDNLHQR